MPWGTLMWDLMKQVCPARWACAPTCRFSELTPAERDIVFNGPAEKKHILYKAKKADTFAELDFTYYNAVLHRGERACEGEGREGAARAWRAFLDARAPCPDCDGTRLSDAAREPQVRGHQPGTRQRRMTLDEAVAWVDGVPGSLPDKMRPMAQIHLRVVSGTRLGACVELGLGYLSLDRAGATLSTGERQRVQLARSVRNRTTGVLYVMDEPSIGLHPANIDGLLGVMRDLIADGNSVVMVDHDTRILARRRLSGGDGPWRGRGRRHGGRARLG